MATYAPSCEFCATGSCFYRVSCEGCRARAAARKDLGPAVAHQADEIEANVLKTVTLNKRDLLKVMDGLLEMAGWWRDEHPPVPGNARLEEGRRYADWVRSM